MGRGGVGGPRNWPRGENARGPGGSQRHVKEGLVGDIEWGGGSQKGERGEGVLECKVSFNSFRPSLDRTSSWKGPGLEKGWKGSAYLPSQRKQQ